MTTTAFTPFSLSVLVAILSYLVGSIPFSFLVARLYGVRDVRQEGSGNVGATNVLRTAGKVAGALALGLDLAKGAVPVVAAGGLAATPGNLPEIAALGAVLGHLFPVWLRFRGGKGVATGAGAFLALAPLATLSSLGVFLVAAALSRFVSVGSVVGAASLPVLAWALGASPATCTMAGVVALLVIVSHRENLARIVRGREHRVGTPRP
jgi:glycerol-3-phosphate acyltransferase PlsY